VPERAGAARLGEWGVVGGTREAEERRAAAVPAAVGAALGAALSGVAVVSAVVLVAWATDSRTGASARDALRVAADAWLLAHHGVLRLPSGTVAAVPLGLTVLPAVLLHRAGVSVARGLLGGGAAAGGPAGREPAGRELRSGDPGARSRGGREAGRSGERASLAEAARAVGALAGAYGVVVALVAKLAAAPGIAVNPVSAGLGGAVLAAVAGGLGAVRAAGLGGAVLARLPAAAPAVARGAAAAVATLVAAGAALVVLGLSLHAGRAIALTRALDPGLVGGVVLLLVCILLAPNAVAWGAAYAVGPGFAVGAGTSVSPFGAVLGPVPALPLLAALPQGGATPQAARAVLLVPLAAGAMAGVLVARSVPQGTPARWAAAAGGCAGVATGLALALLAALAGGPFGGGYLAAVGPSPWQVGLAAIVEVGAPAALAAALYPTRSELAAEPEPSNAGG
jgi:Family of unknown function (DUF6350)